MHILLSILLLVAVGYESLATAGELGSATAIRVAELKKSRARKKQKAKKKSKAKSKQARRPSRLGNKKRPRAQASTKRVGPNARVHRYRTNLALGMNVVRGESALLIGGQFGYAFWERIPAYLGPEINYALNSPQSLFQFLVGGWYQLGIYRSPRMSLTGGILAGLAFPYSHNVIKSTSMAYYLDIAISQEVDDLVSVRGQFRPGFVGSEFAFMMNLSVQFRFP